MRWKLAHSCLLVLGISPIAAQAWILASIQLLGKKNQNQKIIGNIGAGIRSGWEQFSLFSSTYLQDVGIVTMTASAWTCDSTRKSMMTSGSPLLAVVALKAPFAMYGNSNTTCQEFKQRLSLLLPWSIHGNTGIQIGSTL